jgi:hypothetical protein
VKEKQISVGTLQFMASNWHMAAPLGGRATGVVVHIFAEVQGRVLVTY